MSEITSDLRHRITIQSKTRKSQNPSTGQIIYEWEDFTTVWAEVTDLSTRDRLAAQAIQSTIQSRAKIRYSKKSSQIKSDMRVKFEGYYYALDGGPVHDNLSRREWLTLNLKTGEKDWNK